MRNMLQLLGGVAAAGVVAAGATAFTAPGLSNALAGSSTKALAGGTLALSTVDGAQLDGIVTLSSLANKDQITGIRVYLSGLGGVTLNTATSIVTGSITGTSATPTVGVTRQMTCSYNATPLAWDCAVATAGTDYLTALTAVSVSVQAGV